MADQTTDQAAQARAQEAQKANEERREAAKKQIEQQRQAREQAQSEQQSASEGVKPTPTQEEKDLAAMGVHIDQHEPDGSPVQDPNVPQDKTKQMEGQRSGQYQTRAATPKRAE